MPSEMKTFTIEFRDGTFREVEADYFVLKGPWIQFGRHARDGVMGEAGRMMILKVFPNDVIACVNCGEAGEGVGV